MNCDFSLVKPDETYLTAIGEYRRDFIASGDALGHGDCALQHFDDLAEWLAYNRALENHENFESSWKEFDQYLYVRKGDGRVIGMINYRRADNDEKLADYAGEIGYAVRPSERGKGHAKAMLAQCLARCFECGIAEIVIACNKDNTASKRVIAACGGVFERGSAEDQGVERYTTNRKRG